MSISDNTKNYLFCSTVFFTLSSITLHLISKSYCKIENNEIGYYRHLFGEFNKENPLKPGLYPIWLSTEIRKFCKDNKFKYTANFETIDNFIFKDFIINLYFKLDENKFCEKINDNNINERLNDIIGFKCLSILTNLKYDDIRNYDNAKDKLKKELNNEFTEEYGITFTDITYSF